MKTFKLIDAWISVALIVLCTGYCVADRNLETIIGAYFVVGGWQVISMIIHAFNKWFTRKYGYRHIYHWVTFISLVLMPFGGAWVLLFTAPLMAIFYTWLCFGECAALSRRALAQLR